MPTKFEFVGVDSPVLFHLTDFPDRDFRLAVHVIACCEPSSVVAVAQALESPASLILYKLLLFTGFDTVNYNECASNVRDVPVSRIESYGCSRKVTCVNNRGSSFASTLRHTDDPFYL